MEYFLKFRTLFFILAAFSFAATGASAQNFTSRSARIVVGFAPGGATDVTKVLATPELKDRMLKQGSDQSTHNTPEKHAAFVKTEFARWGKVIKDAGIKAE